MVNRNKRETFLWRIYLVVMVGVAVWTVFPLPRELAEIFSLLVSLVGLIGLFGFAFQRRIARRLFWRIWFGLTLFSIAATFSMFIGMLSLGFEVQLQWLVVLVVLNLPMYYALFMYAYRSPHVWKAPRTLG